VGPCHWGKCRHATAEREETGILHLPSAILLVRVTAQRFLGAGVVSDSLGGIDFGSDHREGTDRTGSARPAGRVRTVAACAWLGN